MIVTGQQCYPLCDDSVPSFLAFQLFLLISQTSHAWWAETWSTAIRDRSKTRPTIRLPLRKYERPTCINPLNSTNDVDSCRPSIILFGYRCASRSGELASSGFCVAACLICFSLRSIRSQHHISILTIDNSIDLGEQRNTSRPNVILSSEGRNQHNLHIHQLYRIDSSSTLPTSQNSRNIYNVGEHLHQSTWIPKQLG